MLLGCCPHHRLRDFPLSQTETRHLCSMNSPSPGPHPPPFRLCGCDSPRDLVPVESLSVHPCDRLISLDLVPPGSPHVTAGVRISFFFFLVKLGRETWCLGILFVWVPGHWAVSPAPPAASVTKSTDLFAHLTSRGARPPAPHADKQAQHPGRLSGRVACGVHGSQMETTHVSVS